MQTLEEFSARFSEVVVMGWIRTHRSGPTGVGKTLEDLLGIEENNIDGPDFGVYELKSGRINSGSMLTLFTKAPQPPRANSYLREKYGYSSDVYDNDDKVLHSTLTAARFVPIANTGHRLRIVCSADRINIASDMGVENVYWDKQGLRKAFEKKYRSKLVYVKAESRGDGSLEEFRYVEAWAVAGFDYDAMIELLEEGRIFVDLRIGQYPDGRTHDHGTGFRIRECDEPLLFKERMRL